MQPLWRSDVGIPGRRTARLLFVGNFLSGVTGIRGASEDLSSRLADRGWPVIQVSSRRGRLARAFDMVSTAWRRSDAYSLAVVEVYSGTAFRWAEMTSRVLQLRSKPYVLVLHGGGLVEFAQKNAGRVARLLAGASAIATPSHFLREGLAGYRDDIRYIPNAIDLSAYPARRIERPRPELCWLRALHHIYNPVMAIDVVGLLCREFPEIRLTMYGPDKGDGSWQETAQRASALGVMDRLRMPGKVAKADVPARLTEADIFLNTTNLESFGVSVMEAAACGLCVVSTNVGELPRLWSHGEDALLVPPGDPEAMAEAVRQILRGAGTAARLSGNARAKAERYDWSAILPEWERVVTQVLAEHEARG